MSIKSKKRKEKIMLALRFLLDYLLTSVVLFAFLFLFISIPLAIVFSLMLAIFFMLGGWFLEWRLHHWSKEGKVKALEERIKQYDELINLLEEKMKEEENEGIKRKIQEEINKIKKGKEYLESEKERLLKGDE